MNKLMSVVLTGDASNLSGTLRKAAGEVTAFEKGVEGSSNRVSSSSRLMAAGMAAAGLAIAAGLTFAVIKAAEFETQMRNVNSISKLSEGALADLGSQVLTLSTQVPQSAASLAAGLYDVASSGFQGAEGMQVLTASAIAASAGMSDTATASRAITAVLNAYGLQASDAADVSDILFQAVNVGVVTFDELAGTIGDVVGTAAAATVEIDEVSAAIATMTLSGISAAESGTSLNRLIQSLIDPSEALAGALNSVGYESGLQALQVDDLNVVMEKLRVASGGNIEMLLKWFPEIRSARGALALMANEGQNMAETFGVITDEEARAGAAQDAFNEQMKATGAQLTILGNIITAQAIRIGTNLLPVVQGMISGLQDLGGRAAPLVASALRSLAPFFEGVVKAGRDLLKIAGDLAQDMAPMARLFAGLIVAGVITFLNTFGTLLGAVTGFLGDHEEIVKAVAIAYTAILVAKGVAAVVGWANSVRTAVGSATAALRDHLSNMSEFVDSMGGRMGALKAVMASAAPMVGLMVGLAMLQAAQQAFADAERRANEFWDEVESHTDTSTFEGLNDRLADLQGRLRESRTDLQNAIGDSSHLGAAWRATAEQVSWAENTLTDANQQVQEGIERAREAEEALQQRGIAADIVADRTGRSTEEVNRLASAFGVDLGAALRTANADGLITIEEMAGMAASIDNAANAAEHGTVQTDAISAALEVLSDDTASSTEQLDAFKDALDAIFGVHINAFDAITDVNSAISDLTASVAENGLAFDANTEAGRSNRGSLSDLVQSALDHANAVAQENSSIQDGVDVLNFHREALLNQLEALGMNREEAAALIAQLGLTPEAIETSYELTGEDEAAAALATIQQDLDYADGQVAEGFVVLDIDDFGWNMQLVQNQLLAYAHTDPTTALVLDGQTAEANIATVMAGLAMYGEQSPEATALLNYQPADQNFQTLQEWIDWYVTSDPEAAAYVNSASAKMEMDLLFLQLGRYDLLSPEATAAVASSGANATLTALQGRLDQLDGRSVTSYVNVALSAAGRSVMNALSSVGLRMGGIISHATGGIDGAHIQVGQRIRYAEPETGGEAYIPRLGNRQRSLSILDHAAAWYGQRITPMASGGIVGFAPGGGGGGASVVVAPGAVTVTVNAEAGVDGARLGGLVRDAVEPALQAFGRDLTRELRMRRN